MGPYGLRPCGFKGFIFGFVGSYFSSVLAGGDSDEDHQEAICRGVQYCIFLNETSLLTPEDMIKLGKDEQAGDGSG